MKEKLVYPFDDYQKDVKEEYLTDEDKKVMRARWDEVDDLMFSMIFFMTI